MRQYSYRHFLMFSTAKIHFFCETTNKWRRFSWNTFRFFQNEKMRKWENENFSYPWQKLNHSLLTLVFVEWAPRRAVQSNSGFVLLKQLTVYWQGWQSNHFLYKALSRPNWRHSLLVCRYFDFPVGSENFSRGSARFSRRRRCDDIINCQPPKFWQSEIFDSGGCGVVCTSIFCMSQESPLKGATARLPKEFG